MCFIEPSLLLAEAFVYGLYEHFRCPRSARLTIMDVIVECRLCLFDLIEGHAPADHVLNPIANDGQHRLVLDDIGLIAEAAVTRNDVSSTFLFIRGNGQLNNMIQAGDNPLDIAAPLQVDDRISVDVE